MWEWLAGLPLFWQIGLPITLGMFIVIISIWGNAILSWGKRSIGIGKPSRSCRRCRQLIVTKTYKYRSDRELILQSILRDQMNYAEMKTHEIFLSLCRSYRQTLVDFRKPDKQINTNEEHKEYLIYQESLNGALFLIKNELRRSFKENGFCDMGPTEYTQYCKDKTRALITIGREHIMSRYPYENMIIPLQYRFDQLDIDWIETAVFNLMDRAKEIYIDAQEKLENLDKEYDQSMDKIANE